LSSQSSGKNNNYRNTQDIIYTLGRLQRNGASLYDPESVKTVIKRLNVKDSAKKVYCDQYGVFLRFLGGIWEKPRYAAAEQEKKLLLESDIDQLIAAVSRRTATFCQVIKETGARPGEVLALKWDDVDFGRRLIIINHPEKGSSSRTVKVSPKLMKMLARLPTKSDRVFNMAYQTMYTCFMKQKKRAAEKLSNPTLKKITFRRLRDWRFTMEAHRVHGSMLKVQGFTGHKSIENVMKYIVFEQKVFGDSEYDEFDVVYAESKQEFFKYLQDGYEVVTDYGLEKPKVLRRRK